MAASPAAASAPILLDLDASPIAGQTGWAVLDLQGNVLRRSEMKEEDAAILFQMLQESAVLSEDTPNNGGTSNAWSRLTVTFGETRFLVSRDYTHVYLVQTRAR